MSQVKTVPAPPRASGHPTPRGGWEYDDGRVRFSRSAEVEAGGKTFLVRIVEQVIADKWQREVKRVELPKELLEGPDPGVPRGFRTIDVGLAQCLPVGVSEDVE